MNSVKIEKISINKLKEIIGYHSLMNDFINDNDKEPSWDGFIYLYNSNDLKAENIKYRVPVQVKGKNAPNLLKKQWISYETELKHLRNYYSDGGVFYIVVVISDDGRQSVIFYNALTTAKLNALLKGTENKKPDQHKSITLQRLQKNDEKILYKNLFQFGFDKEKQGSGNGEIINKAINIDVIDKVDSIRVTSYIASDELEVLKKISTGELCLYGHRSDIDMWLPFDYEHQQGMVLKKVVQMNKAIGIDGKMYYDNYLVESIDGGNPIIRVSNNLVIDLIGGKINFERHGTIKELKKDVDFLYATMNGESFWLKDKKIASYVGKNLPQNLREQMEEISEISDAFEEINYTCDKKSDDFTEEDWKAINKLLMIYRREIKPKGDKENIWFMWWWNGKVVPLFLMKEKDGEIKVINWLMENGDAIFTETETGEKYRLPKGLVFSRDIWENLYDIDESVLLEDIEKCDYHKNTRDELYLFFVEVLSAYDATKNEKYYDMANLLITKLLEFEPENEFGIINKLQLLKRKRDLSDEELLELEKIEKKTESDMIPCAVNILLENKRKAKRLIEQLSEEDKDTFKQYPIYNLL